MTLCLKYFRFNASDVSAHTYFRWVEPSKYLHGLLVSSFINELKDLVLKRLRFQPIQTPYSAFSEYAPPRSTQSKQLKMPANNPLKPVPINLKKFG